VNCYGACSQPPKPFILMEYFPKGKKQKFCKKKIPKKFSKNRISAKSRRKFQSSIKTHSVTKKAVE
jgi:hypothetical protein